jgi:predicted dithiol-disulfide oxidoreductase (DUF899 family)
MALRRAAAWRGPFDALTALQAIQRLQAEKQDEANRAVQTAREGAGTGATSASSATPGAPATGQYADSVEVMMHTYRLIDLTPKGREEDGLRFTMEWVRHHDRYEPAPDAKAAPAAGFPATNFRQYFTLTPSKGLLHHCH